jgi:hypothetical protein
MFGWFCVPLTVLFVVWLGEHERAQYEPLPD